MAIETLNKHEFCFVSSSSCPFSSSESGPYRHTSCAVLFFFYRVQAPPLWGKAFGDAIQARPKAVGQRPARLHT